MSFAVDRFGPDDLEAGLRLSTQAGWNQVAADWKRAHDLCPDGFFAGRLDGRVVATGCVASYGRSAAWIGLILVDTACRGRGFGAALFAKTMERAREVAGTAVGLDASDLGRPVYLKQGFVDVAPIDRWVGVLPAATATATTATFEQVADFDRRATGLDRSALLRHLWEDRSGVAFAIPGAGHAFLYPGRQHAHLGPIVAADDRTYVALLEQAAKVLNGAEVVIDALRTPATSTLLQSRGLQVARELTRMTLRSPQPLLTGPSVRAAVSFTWG